jgi:predicted nucleotidyltransferase
VARGSEGPSSDVDLLVSLDSGRTLFDIARLEDELEQLLGCPVDVATDRELADDVKATAAIEARAL